MEANIKKSTLRWTLHDDNYTQNAKPFRSPAFIIPQGYVKLGCWLGKPDAHTTALEAHLIRIILVDDHAIVRAGLKALLSERADMDVKGETGSGSEAVKMVQKGDFDIVLLDVTMPIMNGVDTLKQIHRHCPDLPVLMLSMHPEEQYAINLLRSGASGYVNKEEAPEQLVSAIQTVIEGRKYVSPVLAELLIADLGGNSNKPLHAKLSEREFQIFCRLASGQTASEIGNDLHLSVKTISTYRTRILEKMSMKNNADITLYALKHGMMQ